MSQEVTKFENKNILVLKSSIDINTNTCSYREQLIINGKIDQMGKIYFMGGESIASILSVICLQNAV